MSGYDDTTPHPDPVVQRVAEALAVELYNLGWDMPGFDPFESGYPNESLEQPDFGMVDLARPMSGFPQGWVRLSIDERPGVSAEVMLNPPQVRALYEALGALLDGSTDDA